MQHNGYDRKKRTRWRCSKCGSTKSRAQHSHRPSPELQVEKDFRLFIQWITQHNGLDFIAKMVGVTRRTLTSKFAPFWAIVIPEPTCDQAFDQIFIDGTYLGKGKRKVCLLVARSRMHVLAWRWCKEETKNDYLLLLDRLARPKIVTLDGNLAAVKAVHTKWPDVRIQRCLVHLFRNVQAQTTKAPRTAAHKALKRLGWELTHVRTLEQAEQWCAALGRFEEVFHNYMLEKTYRRDVKDPADIPKHVRCSQQWWFTHYRTRRAFGLLKECMRRGELFTFLEVESEDGTPLLSTTNVLEGGTNAVVKDLVRRHRGMPIEHVRRVVDWNLLAQSTNTKDPVEIARDQEFGQDGLRLAAAKVDKEQAAADDRGAPKSYGAGLEEYQPVHRLG